MQPSPPKISVVICTHNRCDQLADTLISLAQMSVPETLSWEVVVVDNNSSDNTRQVFESFAGSSRLNARYVFERNAGLSHARNRGVAESEGEIISFLDDDVIVASNWLTETWKAFEQYDAMCVGGRVFLHGDPQMPAWWDTAFDVAVGKFDRGDKVIRYGNADGELIGIGANMSFRRIVFEKYGLFETEMGRIGNQQRTGEETGLVLRLGQNDERVFYYPGAVVYHRVSNDRFSKHHLRRDAYHFGKWRYLCDSEMPSKSLKILRTPLWMYRDTLKAAVRMLFLRLLFRRTQAFMQERRVCVYLGYFVAARRNG